MAAYLYGLSATQCNGVGAFNLALCLSTGMGTQRDMREAVRFAKLAVTEKAPNAAQLLHAWTWRLRDFGYGGGDTDEEDVSEEEEEEEEDEGEGEDIVDLAVDTVINGEVDDSDEDSDSDSEL
eukprot:TRINITY_DN1517_c1_g3_i1.p2 TRINITY_DN1517_c1_g3~~TRINITY_DN1517_c1_g3_i1.p2  ORF type:complete len:123 (+),score=44.76 TRINITY_DN1517_c1_g3_i1:906-1274(+)